MTVHLVTFSDESMSRARGLCLDSALSHGVDSGMPYSDDLLEDRRDWQTAWSSQRGFGYWRWKPMLIATRIGDLCDGDILIYADAGVEFINNVSHIIKRMDQDIFLFGNNWEHAHWCKRDVVEAVWPLPPLPPERASLKALTGFAGRDDDFKLVNHLLWKRFHKQCQASVIFFRVSDYSRQFVAEWLKWCLHRTRYSEGVCTDEWRYLIDDSPSVLPNHPEFREHRHDQAILTTLAYREGIKLHWWPSVYNRGGSPEFVYEKLPEYAGDDYPVLFSHHRKRNREFEEAA